MRYETLLGLVCPWTKHPRWFRFLTPNGMEPEIRILADGLGVELDEIRTAVEKRPLEKTIHVDGMGEFEEEQ